MKRTHKTQFPYAYVFLLLKAQLYTLILSKDATVQVRSGIVKRRKNKPALLVRHKVSCWETGAAEGSWYIWHRREAGMTFLHTSDKPHVGLSASLHLKQQASKLGVCTERTWQGRLNGEKYICLPWRKKHWVWTACISLIGFWFFMDKNLNWKSFWPLGLFFCNQVCRFWKGKAEALFWWRKNPFLVESRSFYGLIPPVT